MHIPWGDRVGDMNLGETANLDTDNILLRWFNHWLKDIPDFDGAPRVRYFALGPNEWRTAHEWRLDAAFPLYLASEGSANSRKGNGKLLNHAPETEQPRDVFVYDPEVPVPAPGGVQAMSGPYDQAALELGNNVLVYTSEPVARETEVFGQPRIEFFAATSAPNADFTAKIVRVKPNGRAEFISIGIARSSWLFRDSSYEADEIQHWKFALEPTAFVLAPGECLRLEIASSAFPLYDRNPSTNVSPRVADHWNWGRSTQQILHSPTHPSALYLPVNGEPGW